MWLLNKTLPVNWLPLEAGAAHSTLLWETKTMNVFFVSHLFLTRCRKSQTNTPELSDVAFIQPKEESRRRMFSESVSVSSHQQVTRPAAVVHAGTMRLLSLMNSDF